MSALALDTSGYVRLREIAEHNGARRSVLVWSDLTPFQQGYLEAALREPVPAPYGDGSDECDVAVQCGFSDLAPETLAAMLKDCERRLSLFAPLGWRSDSAPQGREFWQRRQKGDWRDIFPPLTLYLGDDGKVYAREATQ